MYQQKLKQWLACQLEISHGANTPLRAMEGLRGFAVFMVFVVHYSTEITPWLDTGHFIFGIKEFLQKSGHLGVDLFFVLSGYLIYGTIISKPSFNAFAYVHRRIVRIYPTFLAVFSVYLILSFIFSEHSKLPVLMWDKVIYILQNLVFLPGLWDIEPIIFVAWSLSYEVFYYAVIPVIIFGLGMSRWEAQHRLYFWIGVSVCLIGVFSMYYVHARLMMFLAGIVLFEMFRYQQAQVKKGGWLALAIVLVWVNIAHHFKVPLAFSVPVVFIGLFFLCLSAFSHTSSTNHHFQWRPLRWLGNMSYSYYLLHGLVLKFIFLVLPQLYAPQSDLRYGYFTFMIPIFMVTFVASFMLFVMIERPVSLTRKPSSSTAKRSMNSAIEKA